LRVRRSVHLGSLVCAPACAIVSPLQPSFLLFCRGLLVEATAAHLPEHTFTLHSLLQNAKCLLDIIVSDKELHRACSSDVEFVVVDRRPPRSRKPGRRRRHRRAEIRLTRTAFCRRRIDFRDLVKTIGLGIVRPGDERTAHFCAVPSGFDAKSKRLFDSDAARR